MVYTANWWIICHRSHLLGGTRNSYWSIVSGKLTTLVWQLQAPRRMSCWCLDITTWANHMTTSKSPKDPGGTPGWWCVGWQDSPLLPFFGERIFFSFGPLCSFVCFFCLALYIKRMIFNFFFSSINSFLEAHKNTQKSNDWESDWPWAWNKILSRTPVVTATLSLDALNGALKDDMPPMDWQGWNLGEIRVFLAFLGPLGVETSSIHVASLKRMFWSWKLWQDKSLGAETSYLHITMSNSVCIDIFHLSICDNMSTHCIIWGLCCRQTM